MRGGIGAVVQTQIAYNFEQQVKEETGCYRGAMSVRRTETRQVNVNTVREIRNSLNEELATTMLKPRFRKK